MWWSADFVLILSSWAVAGGPGDIRPALNSAHLVFRYDCSPHWHAFIGNLMHFYGSATPALLVPSFEDMWFRGLEIIERKWSNMTSIPLGEMLNTPLLWQVRWLIYICDLRWYIYVLSLLFFLLSLNNWRHNIMMMQRWRRIFHCWNNRCCGSCFSVAPQAERCLTGSWTKVTTQSATPVTWFARCWRQWLISTPSTLSTETSR